MKTVDQDHVEQYAYEEIASDRNLHNILNVCLISKTSGTLCVLVRKCTNQSISNPTIQKPNNKAGYPDHDSKEKIPRHARYVDENMTTFQVSEREGDV